MQPLDHTGRGVEWGNTRAAGLPGPMAKPLEELVGGGVRYNFERDLTLPRIRRAPRITFRMIALTCLAAIVLASAGQLQAGDLDRLLVKSGLGINQIVLTGHSQTADEAVFRAIGLAGAGDEAPSMLGFDTDDAVRRLERLPWVRSVQMKAALPDELHISIRERTPFAVHQLGEDHYLVDETGRRLERVAADQFAELPRLIGEGAAQDGASFIAEVEADDEIAARTLFYERVGERYWRLALANAPIIDLPEENHEAALRWVAEMQRENALLDRDFIRIDLRAFPLVALRLTDKAAEYRRENIVKQRLFAAARLDAGN